MGGVTCQETRPLTAKVSLQTNFETGYYTVLGLLQAPKRRLHPRFHLLFLTEQFMEIWQRRADRRRRCGVACWPDATRWLEISTEPGPGRGRCA